jgi:hypothetical protein
MMRRWQRRTLVTLDAFLAVSAIGGGLALLSHWIDLPTELLKGSPFGSYTIPGLALTFLVGGGALGAAVAVLRSSAFGALLSASAGLMVIVFLMVELFVVGSEPGYMRSLQLVYFANGLLLIAVASWPSTTHRHSIWPLAWPRLVWHRR